jgi:hypothetical protein
MAAIVNRQLRIRDLGLISAIGRMCTMVYIQESEYSRRAASRHRRHSILPSSSRSLLPLRSSLRPPLWFLVSDF